MAKMLPPAPGGRPPSLTTRTRTMDADEAQEHQDAAGDAGRLPAAAGLEEAGGRRVVGGGWDTHFGVILFFFSSFLSGSGGGAAGRRSAGWPARA